MLLVLCSGWLPCVGSGTPSLRVAAETEAPTASRPSAVGAGAWGAGYTSTHIRARAPTSPHHWPRLLADHGGRASKLVLPIRELPTEPAKGPRLRLGALAQPTVRVPHRGRRGRAPGVWHFPSWCPALAGTHLPAAVHRGQNGISCSSPLLEFTSVATNFQSLPLSW